MAIVDKERVEGSTKGGRSHIVSIDAGTVEILRQHRKAQVAERLAAGEFWCDDDDLVFRRLDGRPLYPSTVSALMGKLVAQSGMPPARLHVLRHVHATTLLLPACRCTPWQQDSVMRTLRSPSGCTPTCSASRPPVSPMFRLGDRIGVLTGSAVSAA